MTRNPWAAWPVRLATALLLSVVLTPWLAFTLEELAERRVRWAQIVVAPASMAGFLLGNIHQGNDTILSFTLNAYLFPTVSLVFWLALEALTRVLRKSPVTPPR